MTTPDTLNGYRLVRFDRVQIGDIIVDPDTGDEKPAGAGWAGAAVDESGHVAGGGRVYRKADPLPPEIPDDLAGWQNVREGVVQAGDLLVDSHGKEWAAGCIGRSVNADGATVEGWNVYRKIPVAKQGLASDGTVLKNDQPSPDSKPTNPKDAIGSGKLPLNLVPETAVAYMALAFLEGGLKYGAYNWRAMGVRSSIYYAACRRHLMKWWNGEWQDAKTGVPHLASALACIAIILDADLMKKLTDDRPLANPGLSTLIDQLGDDGVKRLKELFKDENPKHWTISDTP